MPKNGGYVQLFAAPIGTALPNPLFSAPGIYPSYDSLAAFLGANPGWAAAVKDSGVVPSLIGLGAGLFNGGNHTIYGIPVAGSAEYFVLGWTGPDTDATIALTSAMAGQAFMGESAIFTTATEDPFVGAPTPVLIRTTFGGMGFGPVVPEPTTVFLAGLGAVMLVLSRGRR